jgi:hypothetical protein
MVYVLSGIEVRVFAVKGSATNVPTGIQSKVDKLRDLELSTVKAIQNFQTLLFGRNSVFYAGLCLKNR